MRPLYVLTAAFFLMLPWEGAHAEGVYKFVEQDGTIVYTNVSPGSAKKAKKLQGTFVKPVTGVRPKARLKATLNYDTFIDSAATRYRIPAALVRAVMHAESNFNPMALSHKGASGLMQLMPATAESMFVRDIFDERENIEGGTRYLRVLANQFNGDMVKMIAAYNAGPEAVLKYGGKIPPYAETQDYVKKVLHLYYQYKTEASASAASDSQG